MYQLLSYTQLNEITNITYNQNLLNKTEDLTYYYKLEASEQDTQIILGNDNESSSSEQNNDIDEDDKHNDIYDEYNNYVQKNNEKILETLKKYDPIKINIESEKLEKNNIAMPDEIYYELLRTLGNQKVIHCSEYYDINGYRNKYIFTDHHNLYNIKVDLYNNYAKKIRIDISSTINNGFIKMDGLYNDYIIYVVKNKFKILNDIALNDEYSCSGHNDNPLTPEYIYSSYIDIIGATIRNCVNSEIRLNYMDNKINELKEKVKQLKEFILINQ
jgi:hypothetical protein